MTLQDYVMKVSGDFMERIHKLIVIDNVIVFVSHMILRHHVIIWSCDFMGRSHSSPTGLVAVGIVIVEICF